MRLGENDRVVGIAVVPAEVDESPGNGKENGKEPDLPAAPEE